MSPLTVLLVDDHAFFRRSLQRLLQGNEGVEVIGSAANGQEALELSGRLCPDAVVMDIQMPGLTGIDTCRQMKATGAAAKVVLYSASDDLLAFAATAGVADGYLRKDDVFTELIPQVREVASRF